jgi:hypothetical protein
MRFSLFCLVLALLAVPASAQIQCAAHDCGDPSHDSCAAAGVAGDIPCPRVFGEDGEFSCTTAWQNGGDGGVVQNSVGGSVYLYCPGSGAQLFRYFAPGEHGSGYISPRSITYSYTAPSGAEVTVTERCPSPS